MREVDGTEHKVGGVYREIVPGKKLSFTWAWESTPEDETLVTIELRKNGAGTELTLAHTKFAIGIVALMHAKNYPHLKVRSTNGTPIPPIFRSRLSSSMKRRPTRSSRAHAPWRSLVTR